MSKTETFLNILREGVEANAPAEWFGMVVPHLATVIEQEKHAEYLRGVREKS